MKRSTKARILAAAALAGLGGAVQADILTWNNTAAPKGAGADANDTWGVAGNWNPNSLPDGDDIAVLPSLESIAGQGPSINSAYAIGGIQVDNSGEDYTIAFGGGTGVKLTIGASGLNVSGGGTFTMAPELAISVDQTWNIASGSTVTYSRAFPASGGNITVTGGGLLQAPLLNSARTGHTIVEGNATIRTGFNDSLGLGQVTVNNTGTLELATGNSITNWNLQLNDGATVRSVASAGNTATYNKALLALPSGASIRLEGNASTGGTLTFGSNANFNGGNSSSVITIGAGRVNLASGGSVTYNGSWRVESGAVLSLNTNLASQTRPISLSGGTLILNGGVNNSYNFTSTVSVNTGTTATITLDRSGAGTLQDRIVGGLTMGEGSTLNVNISSNVTGTNNPTASPWFAWTPLKVNSITLVGNATFDVAVASIGGANNALATTGITGNFGFEKTGGGRMQIGGTTVNSTYTGPTTVSGGELFLGANAALGLGSTSNLLIKSAGTVRFNKAGDNTDAWTATGGIAGDGILRLGNTGGGTVTISGQKRIVPTGDTAGTAAVLDFQTKLAATLSGSDAPDLVIDVISGNGAGNGVAGTHYDQLAIAQTLTGLDNIDLIVDFNPLSLTADYAGDVLTILSYTSKTGAAFKSFTFNGGSADIVYNATNVQLTNISIPEPASLSLIALTGLSLLGRRKRKQSVN